jgi:hypothetical protein
MVHDVGRLIPSQGAALCLMLAVVWCVLVFPLGVLWVLKRIGGRLFGDVRGSVRRFGATLTVTGSGMLGSYLAIVAAEIAVFLTVLEVTKGFFPR